jgi:tetratricopeptide (TPR) repeat protein
MLCVTYTAQGDLAAALHYGELACEKAPTPLDRVWAQSMLAWAWTRTGRAAEAIEVLSEILPAYEATRFSPGLLFGGVYLGEAFAREGRLDEAVTTLRTAAARAERVQSPFYGGSAHRLLAEVAAQMDATPAGWDRAAGHFEASIGLLSPIRAENELALAYAGYGRLHRQRGDDAAANRFLALAREIFERLGTIVEPGVLPEPSSDR